MTRRAAMFAALLLATAAPVALSAQGHAPRYMAPRYQPRPTMWPPNRPPIPQPRKYEPNIPPPTGPNSLGAEWREQQEEARQGVRRGELAPLGLVIDRLRRRAPGRQLDAGLEYRGDRPVYRVRWMTPSGRRIDYIVDGATGEILSGG